MRLLFVLILLFSSWLAAAQVQSVRVLGLQSSSEASVVYYRDLLQLVLDRTATEFGAARLELVPPPPLGDYRYLLMKRDFIDVHHFGTSPELERDLLPVRVPLLAGGLGWRGFVIRKVDRLAFSPNQRFCRVKAADSLSGRIMA